MKKPITNLVTLIDPVALDRKWFLLYFEQPAFVVAVQYVADWNNFFDWQMQVIDARRAKWYKPLGRIS